ncbi:MAG TPA: asparagine synthase (glutamine-hydrolyzing) [bacterium]|nr:asparagine synthase (glutamine-hydrolyzing) [bacterium]
MCGIAGFTQFKAGLAYQSRDLDAMVAAVKHRGPDDTGTYFNRFTGLGMSRLAIVDLAGGAQPVCNERGTVWVVFNGEIYNHQELRGPLEAAGHRFRSRSDTEVLVHAYEEYGDAFVTRLRGMFAFALWDETFQKLLLARDHLGVKPLYYTTAQGSLLFASEPKALLEAPGVEAKADHRQILSLMTLQYVPSPDTLLKGVRKLPPGHTLTCQSGKVTLKPYWRLPLPTEPMPEKVTAAMEREWVERLRYQFFLSVKEQLMADVPLGAFLSGGLDSSFVVASMTHQTRQRVRTYSVGFDNQKDFNELKHAQRVSAYLKSQHREIMVDARMLQDLIPRLVKYQDDPVLDPAVLPTFVVSLFARQEVKAVLTGEGADEMFGGYRRYAYDRLSGGVRSLPGWLKDRLLPALTGRLGARTGQALDALRKEDLLKRHLAWSRLCREGTLESLAGEGLRYEMEHNRPEEVFERLYEEAQPYGLDPLNLTLYLDLHTWLPDDLLNKVDRMSMAASLEARVPYLDHRLVEFAFSLPSSMKLKGGVGKYLLKRAAQKYLPREIIHRRKQGFGVPLGPWFRKELKPLLVDNLTSERFKRRGLFDLGTTNRLLAEHLEGREDHHLLLYGMLMVELWHQRFIDRSLQDPPGS